MGKNQIPQWAFRCEEEIIKKITYIGKQNERNRNQEIIYIIKKEIEEYEKRYGEIKIEE